MALPKQIRGALLVGFLLSAACGGGDNTDSMHYPLTALRFIAPFEFTTCEIDWDVDCLGCSSDEVRLAFDPCPDTFWTYEPGDEVRYLVNLPPGAFQAEVTIATDRAHCYAFRPFDPAEHATVGLELDCQGLSP